MIDDHRRLGVATAAMIAGMAIAVSVALVLSGRPRLVPSVGAGAAVGLVNVLLLVRGLSRFGRAERLGSGALTGSLVSRFLTVGGVLGVVMVTRTLAPLGVLAGFLLLPVALVTTGAIAARRIPPRRTPAPATEGVSDAC